MLIMSLEEVFVFYGQYLKICRTNNIPFNVIRYIELLKKEHTLKNQGISFSNENDKEDLELLSYKVILEPQIHYNQKADYIFLIEEYLRENSDKAGARLFVWEFFRIFNKINKINKTLEIFEKEILEQGIQRFDSFSIHPKSTEFCDLIYIIASDCEFLTFDPEDTNGMTLDEFHDSIEKIFFQMQQCLDE